MLRSRVAAKVINHGTRAKGDLSLITPISVIMTTLCFD